MQYQSDLVYILVSKIKKLYNVQILNTRYIQHITYKKKDFVIIQPYIYNSISNIKDTKLISKSQKIV